LFPDIIASLPNLACVTSAIRRKPGGNTSNSWLMLMSGHICKNTKHEQDSRKMAGRKMRISRGFVAIFLPAIFLLSGIGLAGEPDFENVS
jgi:hypothetical protein